MHGAIPTGFLVLPAAGDRSLAMILRKLQLLGLRALLGMGAAGLDAATARGLKQLQAILPALARRDPNLVLEALGAPDVLAPLLCLESGVAAHPDMLASALPGLVLALGRSGAMDETVLLDRPLDGLLDVARGLRLRFEPPAQGLCAGPSGVELRLASGALHDLGGSHPGTLQTAAGVEVDEAFFGLAAEAGGAHLSLVDTNPLSHLEDHPDKHGNALDLGGHDAARWVEALRAARDLIDLALPELGRELRLSLRRVVPVGYEPERHLSASYREVPGLVYMTLHPDPLTMAEALIHETQHGKLNALSWLDPVLHNGQRAWTQSPVRPDMRPLMGVLLAAHAFVPVAALHLRLAELGHPLALTPTFAARRGQVLASNGAALASLRELGEPSTVGGRVLQALERVQAHCEAAAANAQSTSG